MTFNTGRRTAAVGCSRSNHLLRNVVIYRLADLIPLSRIKHP